MSERVVLFIDWQNVFAQARRLFHAGQRGSQVADGQIDPKKLADLLCQCAPLGVQRELEDVRIYCGLADQHEQPKMFVSRSNQSRAWRLAGATVSTRPLQYLNQQGSNRKIAREKGIDVAIAIDFVAMAIRGQYDVGILFFGGHRLAAAARIRSA